MDLTEVQRHVNLLEQYNGIDEKELDALFLQFEAMDVDQDGFILFFFSSNFNSILTYIYINLKRLYY